VAHLVVENGPLAGQRLEVEAELTIGRDGADVVIDDVKLSRRHAVFRVVDGGLEVEDLGSTNGTFIDGQRIDARTPIKNGSHVQLGGSSFVAEIEAPLRPPQATETILDGATQLETPAADPGRTVVRPRAQPRAEPRAAAPRRAAPAPAPLMSGPLAPATPGAFAPPHARRGGLATRSWLPVALSFGTVFVVAVALVIYFAAR
jgi:pSer/pThr/pTyr-binding forkhead associated (FHA) protein